MIGVVIGVPTLKELFDEKYYADLNGGILGSFGRMFRTTSNSMPIRSRANTGAAHHAGDLRVAPHLRHLHAFFIENRLIEGLATTTKSPPNLFSRHSAKAPSGDASSETMSPPVGRRMIRDHKLFGWKGH